MRRLLQISLSCFVLFSYFSCGYDESETLLIGDEGAFDGGGGSGLTLSAALENKGLGALPPASTIISSTTETVVTRSDNKEMQWIDYIFSKAHANTPQNAPRVIEMLKGWNVIDFFFDRESVHNILSRRPDDVSPCPRDSDPPEEVYSDYTRSKLACESIGNLASDLAGLTDMNSCVLSRIPSFPQLFTDGADPSQSFDNLDGIFRQGQKDRYVALKIGDMGTFWVKITGRENFSDGYEFQSQFCSNFSDSDEDYEGYERIRVNTSLGRYERVYEYWPGKWGDPTDEDMSEVDKGIRYITADLEVLPSGNILFDLDKPRYIYEKVLFNGGYGDSPYIERRMSITKIENTSSGGNMLIRKFNSSNDFEDGEELSSGSRIYEVIQADYRASDLFDMTFSEAKIFKRNDGVYPSDDPKLRTGEIQDISIRWIDGSYNLVDSNYGLSIPLYTDEILDGVGFEPSEHPYYLNPDAYLDENIGDFDNVIYPDTGNLMSANAGGRLYHSSNMKPDNQYQFNPSAHVFSCDTVTLDQNDTTKTYPDVYLSVHTDQLRVLENDGMSMLMIDDAKDFAKEIYLPCGGIEDVLRPLSSVCRGRLEESAIPEEGLPFLQELPDGTLTEDYIYPSAGALNLMSVTYAIDSGHMNLETDENINRFFACDSDFRVDFDDLNIWLDSFIAGETDTLMAPPCLDEPLCIDGEESGEDD